MGNLSYRKVEISERFARRVRRGYLWVFRNEIVSGSDFAPGELVAVYETGGRFIGVGYVNVKSTIALRMLSFREEPITRDFFLKRITAAGELRRRQGYAADGSFRFIFSEGDLLPGLIVDKYGELLVLQVSTAGMELLKSSVVDALREIWRPKIILEKSDTAARKLEGLKEEVGVLDGEAHEPWPATINGCRYLLDILAGQKTGHYLDQECNRLIAAQYAAGAETLDAFSFSGGFALQFARAGAASVLAVDSSEAAVETLKRNSELNGCAERITPLKGDVSALLKELKSSGRRFGLINLDPPAFAPSHKMVAAASRGYRDLNAAGIALLKPGGILTTSSCSQAVGREDFLKLLKEAASKAQARMRVLAVHTQPPDHPMLLSMPETEYLKFVVLQRLN